MVSQEDVLEVVREQGPVLPVQIKKKVGSDTLTIGAVLSELSNADKVLISNTKIGGSPTYYVPDQAPKLQELKKYLNDKQQKAFDMLKEKKVLRDDKQEAVFRLSFREMKDFAKPLEVNSKEGKLIYWKWYLVGNEEAESLIRKDLGVKEKAKPPAEPEEPEPERTEGLEDVDDEFVEEIRDFFKEKNIEVVEENIVRKGSEAEYVIKVPSPIGQQEYYCKAKSKKKCNDGDLSSAYIQGQAKKLPVLFLMKGEMTNKAEDMLDNEFKGMMVKKF